jgi:RNA polymerase sigma-70 factor (ECF subfamily)
VLLEQIAQGDEAAFGLLFHAYFPTLRPFLLKLTLSAADTEEVLQETFVRLWMGRDKLADVQNLNAWVFTVASNECYKYLRRKNLRRDGLSSLGLHEDDQTTLDTVHFHEVSRLIAEAVRLLPTQRRRIYRMSRDEGLKIPEIATALHLSPNTVKNVLVTSLRFIRQYLEAHGHPL